MDKVIVYVTGTDKVMLFPREYAKKAQKKFDLGHAAYTLQKLLEVDNLDADRRLDLYNKMNKMMGQIIRLNRQIPPCGESLN